MATKIVLEDLDGNNYADWRIWMKNYLLANDLWDVIEANEKLEEDEAELKAWTRKNAAALHAIHVSCSLEVFSHIREIDSAKSCWETLAIMNEVKPAVKPPATEVDAYVQFHPLREAIEKGDLNSVKTFLQLHSDTVHRKVSGFGETALHLATMTGNLNIVEFLVELMSVEDVLAVDKRNETALIGAAATGATKIAECMLRKTMDLVTIADDDLPVTVACNNGHKETTQYLYSVTPFDILLPENGTFGSSLLVVSFFREMFDISLDLLQRGPSLATTRTQLGNTPLDQFSGLSHLFPSGNRYVFWKRWIYSCIPVELPAGPTPGDVRIAIPENDDHVRQGMVEMPSLSLKLLEFFGLKQIYDRKLSHAYARELLHLMAKHISSSIDDTKFEENGIYDAFFGAIKYGVVEVVIELLKANSNLLTVVDKKSRNVLMNAVHYRRENVFSIIYALGTRKYILINGAHKFENNILHLAAKLSRPDRLAGISGAALQMQRELQWYKEVESIVDPLSKEYTNIDGDNANKIFSETHQQLVIDGEKWMKEKATSCTVVGALIITLMFSASFAVTVESNDQETGDPIFSHQIEFTIFIISDTISLFAFSTSVLMFLGVLTSRYSEDDFLKSLPTKLIIGLSALFLSISTMMVAFCSILMIVLQRELKLVLPITLLASIPVTLFILLQFPLLVEIFISTYGPGVFNRKMKYWY
ncbi:uncharacterized protein LOC105638666 [Jatropha curcas]|uniref:uncharacterized protein LOC105638666 n=1 Tax=Jatropha curcas TaxID=180498 RepID=UPI001894B67D|nr:uncharacterized protein LOC105638666 [Jatropha curcas]